MPVSKLRPIYRMRLVITTCNAQLICKSCTNLNQGSQKNEALTTSRSYKLLLQIAWCKLALTNYYLVWLSLLKSPALVNDYWTVINTAVTEGSKHFLLRRRRGRGKGGDNVYP